MRILVFLLSSGLVLCQNEWISKNCQAKPDGLYVCSDLKLKRGNLICFSEKKGKYVAGICSQATRFTLEGQLRPSNSAVVGPGHSASMPLFEYYIKDGHKFLNLNEQGEIISSINGPRFTSAPGGGKINVGMYLNLRLENGKLIASNLPDAFSWSK